jgi:GTPase SAR1 family protein
MNEITRQDFESPELLYRTDLILLLFEANNADQVTFVRETISKIEATEFLRFTPVILMQTKMDQDGVGTLQRSQQGKQLAESLGIECYREVSCKNKDSGADVSESLMRILIDPKLAMSKEKLKLASEVDPSSSLMNLLGSQDEQSSPMLKVSVIMTIMAGVGFFLLKKCRFG